MKKREYSLDVLKIIGTILIMFHHYQQDTKVFFEGKLNFYDGRFYFGIIVELFFILSGYFMYGYIKRIEDGYSFPKFYIKRFARLFPLLIISSVCYEVLVVLYERVYLAPWQDIPPTLWGVIITSFAVQDGWAFANPFVNNPTWYISVLMLCYVVFYVLVYFADRLGCKVQYLFVFMIFLGVGIQTYGINLPFLNSSSCRGYYAFFFGIILADILKDREITFKSLWLSIGVIASITALIVFRYDFVSNGINYIMTFVYFPATIIVSKSDVVAKVFNHSFVGELGKISFDVFIWHSPINILLLIVIKMFNFGCNMNSYKMMVIYALICFVVGAVSYIFIEKPMTGLINRRLKSIDN